MIFLMYRSCQLSPRWDEPSGSEIQSKLVGARKLVVARELVVPRELVMTSMQAHT